MSVIDDYLKNVEPAKRKELERIRKIIKKEVPDAEEVISYGIPAFKHNGKRFFYFAAFKNHLSIFPGAPLKLKDKLKDYKQAKGTIQFTVEKPLPEDVIKEIIRWRLEDLAKNPKARY